jgi:hypothetical protein
MSKEAKFTCYFIIGLACLAIVILGGCSRLNGIRGDIYHEGIIIAKTNCAFELVLEMTPEHVIVETIAHEYGDRLVQEKYQYVNDGKYRIERKKCEI